MINTSWSDHQVKVKPRSGWHAQINRGTTLTSSTLHTPTLVLETFGGRVVLIIYYQISNSPTKTPYAILTHDSVRWLGNSPVSLLVPLAVGGKAEALWGLTTGPEHPRWLPHSHTQCLYTSLCESIIYPGAFSSQYGQASYKGVSFYQYKDTQCKTFSRLKIGADRPQTHQY